MTLTSWFRGAHRAKQPRQPAQRPHGRRYRPHLEALERRDLLATVAWIGPSGDNWDTLADWSSGQLPGATDDVVIPADVAILHPTGADAIDSLTSGGGDTLNLTGGTLTLAAASTFNLLDLFGSGTLTGSGNATVSGLFTWTGGTLAGGGTITANGGIAINGAFAGEVMDTRTLVNNGVAVLTGADDALTLFHGAVWNNARGSTFDFQSDNPLNGTGTFNNAGTVEKTLPTGVPSDTGTASINVVFNNGGTVAALANTGTLDLNGGGSSTAGSFTVAAGAVLGLGSTATNTLTIDAATTESGAGIASFPAGTVLFDGTYAVTGSTDVTGGTVDFSAAKVVQSIGDPLTIGFRGNATFPDGLTFNLTVLTVIGTVNFGRDTVNAGTVLLNNGTYHGADTLTVSGLFTWTGGTLSGSGTTTANGGILLNGAFSGETLDGRTLNNRNAGTALLSGVDNALEFLHGAVWNNTAGSTFDFQSDNVLTGSGTFDNAGTVEKTLPPDASSDNGTAAIDIAFANTGGTVAAFANAGTLNLDGGDSSTAGSFTVAAGATLGLGGSATTAFTVDAASSESGAGIASFNTGTVLFNGTYAITGSTDVTGGTVDLSAAKKVQSIGDPLTVGFRGNATFPDGLTFNLSALTVIGTLNFGSDTVNAGTVLLNNGTYHGADTLTVSGLFTWTGGTLSGTGTTTANGGMLINGAFSGETLDGRTLVNNGSAALTGIDNGLEFLNSGAWNNAPGSTFDFRSDNPLTGSGTFNNAGVVAKTAGAGESDVNVPFVNRVGATAGTVHAASGTLGFNQPLANAGTVLVDAGATLQLQGDETQSAGATTVNGTLDFRGASPDTVAIDGGALSGSGTIDDNVVNNAQLTPASLSIHGSYTQGATGILAVALGGTTAGGQFDQLNVAGNVTLGGTLQVSYRNSFTPAQGNAFAVLTFASRVGDFSHETGLTFAGGTLSPVYSAANLQLDAGPRPRTTDTWTGLGSAATWLDAANWQGSVAPAVGDDLVFPANAVQLSNSDNFPDGTAFHSLTFTGGYAVRGSRLALSAGGITANLAGGATVNLADNVSLAADATIAVAGGTLTLGGTIDTGAATLTITGSGTLDLIGTLIVEPAGHLIDQGTVNAGQALTLGNVGGVSIVGALDDLGTMTVAPNAAFNVITRTTVEADAVLDDQGAVTVGSGATLNALGSLTVDRGATLTDQGTVNSFAALAGSTPAGLAVAGRLAIVPGGTLNADGAAVAAGGFLSDQGALILPAQFGALIDDGVVVVDQGGSLDDLGSLTVAGTLGIYGTATVDVPLSAPAGTLDDRGAVAVASQGVLTVLGGLTIDLGAALLDNGQVDLRAGTLTDNGQLTIGATGVLDDAGAVNVPSGGAVTLLPQARATVELQATALVAGTATLGGTLTVNGSLTLTGTLADQGQLVVGAAPAHLADQGTLHVLAGAALANRATVLVQGTTAAPALLLLDGTMTGPVTVAGHGTLAGSGLAGQVLVQGGTVHPGPLGGLGTLAAASADFSGGGTLQGAVFGTTAGSFSQLSLTGSLTLGGTSTLALDLSALRVPGSAAVVVDKGQTGTFTTVQLQHRFAALTDLVVYKGAAVTLLAGTSRLFVKQNGSNPITGTATSLHAFAGELFQGTVLTIHDSQNPQSSIVSLAINWGDRTPLDTTTGRITGGAGGSYSITGGHTYAAAGSDSIVVTVVDPSNAINGSSAPIPMTVVAPPLLQGQTTWQPVAGLPQPAQGFAVTTGQAVFASATASTPAAPALIYAIGGTALGRGENELPTGTVQVYDPRTNAWSAGPSLNVPRFGLGAATGADGTVFAIGGSDAFESVLHSVEFLAPGATGWLSAPNLPTARANLAVVTGPDAKIYAIGGADAFGNALNTVEAFTYGQHAATGSWRSGLAALPFAVTAPVAVTANGLIYVMGTGSDTLQAYNPGTNQWTQEAPAPFTDHSVAQALQLALGSDGGIYAVDEDLSNNSSAMARYDVPTNTWSLTGPALPIAGGNPLTLAPGPDGRLYAIDEALLLSGAGTPQPSFAFRPQAIVQLTESVVTTTVVGAFFDPNGFDTAALFPSNHVQINWGDGTVAHPDVTTGTVVELGPHDFVIEGTHAYAKPVLVNKRLGLYTIASTALGNTGAQVATTGFAVVVAAPLSLFNPAAAVHGVAGAPITPPGFVILASNLGAKASDFRVSMQFTATDGAAGATVVAEGPVATAPKLGGVGTGNASDLRVFFGGGTTALETGNLFAIEPTPTFTYLAPGAYTVTIEVFDPTDGADLKYNESVSIADAAIKFATTASPLGVPAALLGLGAAGNLEAQQAGNNTTQPAGEIVQGVAFSASFGDFSDPNTTLNPLHLGGSPPDFTATVDFGDGTPLLTVPGFGAAAPGVFKAFTQDDPRDTHTYAAPGTFTVTLTVTDKFGGSASLAQRVTVSPAPLVFFNNTLSDGTTGLADQLVAPQVLQATAGSPATLQVGILYAAAAEPPAGFPISINWGDGSLASSGFAVLVNQPLPDPDSVTGTGFIYDVYGTHTYPASLFPAGSTQNSKPFTITTTIIEPGVTPPLKPVTDTVNVGNAAQFGGSLEAFLQDEQNALNATPDYTAEVPVLGNVLKTLTDGASSTQFLTQLAAVLSAQTQPNVETLTLSPVIVTGGGSFALTYGSAGGPTATIADPHGITAGDVQAALNATFASPQQNPTNAGFTNLGGAGSPIPGTVTVTQVGDLFVLAFSSGFKTPATLSSSSAAVSAITGAHAAADLDGAHMQNALAALQAGLNDIGGTGSFGFTPSLQTSVGSTFNFNFTETYQTTPHVQFALGLGLPLHLQGDVGIHLSFTVAFKVGFRILTQLGQPDQVTLQLDAHGKPLGSLTVTAHADFASQSAIFGTFGLLQVMVLDGIWDPLNGPSTFGAGNPPNPTVVPKSNLDVSFSLALVAGTPQIKVTSNFTLSLFVVATIADFAQPETVADFLAAGGSAAANPFPTLLADLEIKVNPFAGVSQGGGTVDVALDNIRLDLGGLLSSIVRPIITAVHAVTGPLGPIAQFLTAPVPGLSELNNLVGAPLGTDLSFGTVLGILGGLSLAQINSLLDFARAVNDVNTIYDSILPSLSTGTVWLPLGNIDLTPNPTLGGATVQPASSADAVSNGLVDLTGLIAGGAPPPSANPVNPLDAANTALGNTFFAAPDDAGAPTPPLTEFDAQTNSTLDFPLLDNPLLAASLFLGQTNVPVFKLGLSANVALNVTIPIPVTEFGIPVNALVTLGVSLDAGATFTVTSGAIAAAVGPNPSLTNLLAGLAVQNAFVTFALSVGAGGGIDIGVGSVDLVLTLSLSDTITLLDNNATSPFHGTSTIPFADLFSGAVLPQFAPVKGTLTLSINAYDPFGDTVGQLTLGSVSFTI